MASSCSNCSKVSCTVHALHSPSSLQAATMQSGHSSSSDSVDPVAMLSEKLRLVWTSCVHSVVQAVVLKGLPASLQSSARSVLQESHWRHTHPQVRWLLFTANSSEDMYKLVCNGLLWRLTLDNLAQLACAQAQQQDAFENPVSQKLVFQRSNLAQRDLINQSTSTLVDPYPSCFTKRAARSAHDGLCGAGEGQKQPCPPCSGLAVPKHCSYSHSRTVPAAACTC